MTNQRLIENQKNYTFFSQVHPLQSIEFLQENFLIFKKLKSNALCSRSSVFLAQENLTKKICVLKIIKLDLNDRKYIQRVFHQSARQGSCKKHKFLQYSCWCELNVLRVARQALLQHRSPCFPFLYVSFILQEDAKREKELQLVYCMEYLSQITLAYWLRTLIAQIRRQPKQSKNQTIFFVEKQFSLLFFHIFAALYVLQTAGFFHNDLHLHNILMVQSKEAHKDFVYCINGQYFLIENQLGHCLKQLPMICDFGLACDLTRSHNVSYKEHFLQTQRCAYHQANGMENSCCFFTQFCDVFHFLNHFKTELNTHPNAEIFETAFEPFEKLRTSLEYKFKNRCHEKDSFFNDIILANYVQMANEKLSKQDFLLFRCGE